METETLIPVHEAAARYGLTVRQVEHMYTRGLLRLEKRIGVRANLVRPSDVEAALARKQPRGRPRKED